MRINIALRYNIWMILIVVCLGAAIITYEHVRKPSLSYSVNLLTLTLLTYGLEHEEFPFNMRGDSFSMYDLMKGNDEAPNENAFSDIKWIKPFEYDNRNRCIINKKIYYLNKDKHKFMDANNNNVIILVADGKECDNCYYIVTADLRIYSISCSHIDSPLVLLGEMFTEIEKKHKILDSNFGIYNLGNSVIGNR